MFSKCYSLKGINIPKFKLANLTCLRWMFYGCTKLINLDITKFIFNVNNDIKSMFSKCSDELKNKIKMNNKNIPDEVFINE